MVKQTVKEFAERHKIENDVVVAHLKKVTGFKKDAVTALLDQDIQTLDLKIKECLLALLEETKDNTSTPARERITITRKNVSKQAVISSSTGKKTQVTVVRSRKRVYSKDATAAQPVEVDEITALTQQTAADAAVPVHTAGEPGSAQHPEAAIVGAQAVPSSPDVAADTAAVTAEITSTAKTAEGQNVDVPAAAPAVTRKLNLEEERELAKKNKKKAVDILEQELKEKNKKAKERKKERVNRFDVYDIEVVKKDLADIEVEEVAPVPLLSPLARPKLRVVSGALEKQMKHHAFAKPSKPVAKVIIIPQQITVADLAHKMSIKSGEVIKKLIQLGTVVNINQMLEQDIAQIVVEELGHIPLLASVDAIEQDLLQRIQQDFATAKTILRSPVVTVMGHVDHGKTSLLDYIRKTHVTQREAGGITQHIGAYHVTTPHGKITFLDTPGHSAFSAMRARGANCTDIVVLVVAADDGVMPQTIEAIAHARAAKAPIIVAVNKIDKPEANIEQVKQALTQYEIVSEDWGGENQFVPLSAKTGQGVEDLLAAILVQSEVLELRAPIDVNAQGVVIETKLDKGRGPVATILVQKGTLKQGDTVLVGTKYGKVRAMFDAAAQELTSAGPSIPVEILGLNGLPAAGDQVLVVSDEKIARQISELRAVKQQHDKQTVAGAVTMEDMFTKKQESGAATALNLIVKADVHGSLEAITAALEKLSSDTVVVKVLGSGVGAITESDVTLAMAAKAIIIGFNVRADNVAKQMAQNENVPIVYHSIIYNVIDQVKEAIKGLLAPELQEKILGLATVREVFHSAKYGAVAGCMVTEGAIKRSKPIRVLRNNVVIYEGELESLRRYKEDVAEARNGMECGIGVKNYTDVRVGDQIEVFDRVMVQR